jgi:hypothetical protein
MGKHYELLVPETSVMVCSRERQGRSQVRALRDLGFSPSLVDVETGLNIPPHVRVIVVVTRAVSHTTSDACNEWWRRNKARHCLVRAVGTTSVLGQLVSGGVLTETPGSKVPALGNFRCFTEWVEGLLDRWPEASSKDIADVGEEMGLRSIDKKTINRGVRRWREAVGLGPLPRGGTANSGHFPSNYDGDRVATVPVNPMPKARGVVTWDNFVGDSKVAMKLMDEIRGRRNSQGIAPPAPPALYIPPAPVREEVAEAALKEILEAREEAPPVVPAKPRVKPKAVSEVNPAYLKEEVALILAWMREFGVQRITIDGKTGGVTLSNRPHRPAPVSDEPVFTIIGD